MVKHLFIVMDLFSRIDVNKTIKYVIDALENILLHNYQLAFIIFSPLSLCLKFFLLKDSVYLSFLSCRCRSVMFIQLLMLL